MFILCLLSLTLRQRAHWQRLRVAALQKTHLQTQPSITRLVTASGALIAKGRGILLSSKHNRSLFTLSLSVHLLMRTLYFYLFLLGFVLSTQAQTIESGSYQPVCDTITIDRLTTSTNYVDFENVVFYSDAVYQGNASKTTISSQPLILFKKSSPGGIVCVKSGGNSVKSVTLNVYSASTSSKIEFEVYGSNTPYSTSADLWDTSKNGTLVKSFTVTEAGTYTINFDADYAYWGVKKPSGSYSNLASIIVQWDTPTFNFSMPETKFSTLWLNQAFVMPENLTGGIITGANNGEAQVDYRYTAGSVVPPLTPVLLYGNQGDYALQLVGSTEVAPEGNLLHGGNAVDSEGKTYVEGKGVKYYILSSNQSGTDYGFYYGAADGAAITYPAGSHKAFLALPASETMPSSLTLRAPGVTSIPAVENERQDAAIYLLDGRRVKAASTKIKGIYIHNGRKYLR